MTNKTCWCSTIIILTATLGFSQNPDRGLSGSGVERISKEVRHEILLLPYYGVFDILSYKVDPDGTVNLSGAVARPTLKSDAENVVKRIEGVEKVNNQIKVLPLSPNDDRIRREAFRAIYGFPALNKYAWESVQSIHIIVDNGTLTLEGLVDSESDKNAAEIQAKAVSGAFKVVNDLKVGSPSGIAQGDAIRGSAVASPKNSRKPPLDLAV
jgi:hyperosmotically inducible protein